MTGIPVCIFAKPPVPGKVKTRLALEIGDEPAASLASAMLRDVWTTVQATAEVMPVLAATTEGPFPITVSQKNLWLQETGDLGVRIESILRRGLQEAPAAIALGADSPLLASSHLQEAVQKLVVSDAVLGPSCDGGFYLLGLCRCPSGLLDGIPWSSAETREKTMERLCFRGMRVSQLQTLPDVDQFEDLRGLYKILQKSPPEIASATRQWFVQHDLFLQKFAWSAL